jgi:hypothetical protein
VSPAIIIHYDSGGHPSAYLARFGDAERIELRGYCASACTLALSAGEKVCVAPEARLVFHRASSPAWTWLLFQFYPAAIQRWLEARGGLRTQLLTMTGRQAIAFGIKECLR